MRSWPCCRSGSPAAAASAEADRACLLRRGLDAQDRARLLVRGDIDQAIRPGLHVTHALPEVAEQGFAAQLLEFLVDQDAVQAAGARRFGVTRAGDEQVALPFRQRIALV